jgi:hypothetical protein
LRDERKAREKATFRGVEPILPDNKNHAPGFLEARMAGKLYKRENVDLGKKGSFTVRKGALHKALGVPQDEAIPKSKLAEHHTGKLGRMIASARGFAAMKK